MGKVSIPFPMTPILPPGWTNNCSSFFGAMSWVPLMDPLRFVRPRITWTPDLGGDSFCRPWVCKTPPIPAAWDQAIAHERAQKAIAGVQNIFPILTELMILIQTHYRIRYNPP